MLLGSTTFDTDLPDLSDGVMMCDALQPDWRVVIASTRCLQLLGLSRSQGIGRKLWDVLQVPGAAPALHGSHVHVQAPGCMAGQEIAGLDAWQARVHHSHCAAVIMPRSLPSDTTCKVTAINHAWVPKKRACARVWQARMQRSL